MDNQNNNYDKKNVWWLGLVSFFTDVSSEMIFPILPIFLTTVLNANMAVIGLIEGIAESTASLLKLFSGWLADKLKRKKSLVLIGYSLSGLTKPILALATSWWHVLAVRVADRIGKGIRTSPRDALIAASVSQSERGKFFGIHRMLDTLGAIIGTMLASLLLFLFVNQQPFKLIFWLSLIPGLIAVGLIIFKVKEKVDVSPVKKTVSLNIKNLNPNYKKFVFIIGLFGLANFSYAFFLLKAKDTGLALALIPIIYLVYNIFYAALSVPVGKLSDKVGRKKILVFGLALFGLVSLGFGFFNDPMTIWILFALLGTFMAVTDGVSRAYISDLVPAENRGTALGFYNFLLGITVLPANLIGGLLWQKINPAAPFIYAAVLAIVAAILLATLIKSESKTN